MYAIRTAWQEETVLKTKRRWLRCNVWSSYIGMPTLCGRTYFLNAAKKTLSIVYELQLLPVLCPCTFSQRVFAEIHTFSSKLLVEPCVFLLMSLLREIFCTTFSKTSHAVDTTQARANCVQNENSETHALCASCVWIATSRCNPNNSKLREQYSPRSLFDVTF